MTPSYGFQGSSQTMEGIAVVGEAVHRVSPESAEFLIEITTAAPTAAQALRDHETRSAHIAQTVAPLGVQRADLQTISLNVVNFYTPTMPMLPPFGSSSQLGMPSGFGFPAATTPIQSDVQFGAYQVRNLLRVTVRETARVGEVVDALAKAGASLAGGFAYRAADESGARKAVLDEAARDARAKAQTLAAATGKQVGDPQMIVEDLVASNGVYAALRARLPFAFGPGAPNGTGELEYYARVTASFRLQ